MNLKRILNSATKVLMYAGPVVVLIAILVASIRVGLGHRGTQGMLTLVTGLFALSSVVSALYQKHLVKGGGET